MADKKEDQKKEQIFVPNQKSFIFRDSDLPPGEPWRQEKIDEEVNAWLLKMSKEGKAPMLGKVASSSGVIVYVFLYSEKIDK